VDGEVSAYTLAPNGQLGDERQLYKPHTGWEDLSVVSWGTHLYPGGSLNGLSRWSDGGLSLHKKRDGVGSDSVVVLN